MEAKRRSKAGSGAGGKAERVCERCATELSDKEQGWGTALCDGCWDSWFRQYKLTLTLTLILALALSLTPTLVLTLTLTPTPSLTLTQAPTSA